MKRPDENKKWFKRSSIALSLSFQFKLFHASIEYLSSPSHLSSLISHVQMIDVMQ
jgi:hypothetical protein